MADEDEKEQQLLETIASQKIAIAALPSLRSIVEETGIASPETKARAQQIKELSENEEELELLLESKRVAAVIRLQDEMHPPQNSEDCPICLETIKHVNTTTVSRFYCCGGFACKHCADERTSKLKNGFGDAMFNNKCPLCREIFPQAGKEMMRKMLQHSNKGKAWAQVSLGALYMCEERSKKFGFPLDKAKGRQLIKQAAEQHNSDACYLIAIEHDRLGETAPGQKVMKEAADLGHIAAQYEIARDMALLVTQSDCSDTRETLLHYVTLAASQGESNACCILGQMFMKDEGLKMFESAECGLTKSFVLAKHYSEKGMEHTHESHAAVEACKIATAIWNLGVERYEGIVEIPGYSPIPKALFWARKALDIESPIMKDHAIKLLSHIEPDAQNHCTNCRKLSESASFKRCVRCSGAWYCGKECQVAHWKAGHKIDCIKKN